MANMLAELTRDMCGSKSGTYHRGQTHVRHIRLRSRHNWGSFYALEKSLCVCACLGSINKHLKIPHGWDFCFVSGATQKLDSLEHQIDGALVQRLRVDLGLGGAR